jgi:hypothetical protein
LSLGSTICGLPRISCTDLQKLSSVEDTSSASAEISRIFDAG